MKFALRIDSRIQVYEDEGEYSNQNSNSNSKYLKKNSFNKQCYNKKNPSKSSTKNIDNRHINTSESSNQKYNSDLDKLTKKFANMSLHGSSQSSKSCNKIDNKYYKPKFPNSNKESYIIPNQKHLKFDLNDIKRKTLEVNSNTSSNQTNKKFKLKDNPIPIKTKALL
ncbi:hypothetical protein LY90DRAFT_648392 [Neocallimastix californiae]|uniref:Uncharacterized protein n=1 Tax=Neocallimastix californiae TaxID=1754190 RepID=A0A1Y2CYS1_9FUNG|nr:hypothetical protein LY90DRAFT_648392 [Neocallimastix californiae]|eukprot:ORY52168.1 hypothetical protein LY90DRAFT_648392 [Neocallimastix californiae]